MVQRNRSREKFAKRRMRHRRPIPILVSTLLALLLACEGPVAPAPAAVPPPAPEPALAPVAEPVPESKTGPLSVTIFQNPDPVDQGYILLEASVGGAATGPVTYEWTATVYYSPDHLRNTFTTSEYTLSVRDPAGLSGADPYWEIALTIQRGGESASDHLRLE